MKFLMSSIGVIVLTVTCACYKVSSHANEPAPESPDAVVAYLIMLQHGPERTTERGRQLMAHLRAHPDRYAEAVAERLHLPDDIAAVDETDVRMSALGGGLTLASALGSKYGAPLLQRFLETSADRIDRARAPEPHKPDTRPPALARNIKSLDL